MIRLRPFLSSSLPKPKTKVQDSQFSTDCGKTVEKCESTCKQGAGGGASVEPGAVFKILESSISFCGIVQGV